MKNENFCHLHLHNQYSLLDGFGSEQAFAKKAKELGFKYLALTNHGNIDGLIKHQKACLSENIIPLFGCEMYIVSDNSNKELKADHITLLVKNQSGWKTLCRLLTFANLEGFYKRPKINHKIFLEEDLTGLIILTGCTASFLRSDLGEALFWNLVDEIGKDLYLEIMPHDMPEQIEHNKKCKDLSMKYGISLVATNDCHYINKDENVIQEVLLAVQTHSKWEDKNRWKFDIKGLHLRSYGEMKVAFKKQNVFSKKEYTAALHQTIEIAKKCENFRIEKREVFLPKIKRLKKYSIYKTDVKYLSFLCIKGKDKIKNWNEKYQDRLQYELNIIKQKKFERYFLIVWDLVRWCKKSDIMIGSGRGSVGGSLVAYLLNITCVDPIKYNLLFSRFINEERIDLPDIDIDFEHKKRDQVRQYLIKKYGEDNVAGISTFLEMKGKATVRDVSRVFDIPLKEADEFAKAIEYGNEKSSINEMLRTTREGKIFKNKYPLQAKYSSKLEGTIKSTGQHAAAVIISPKNLKDGGITNLCRKGKDKTVVVNWDMEDAEYMGLVKLDILGLSTLSILSEANKLIEENYKKKIKFDKIRPVNTLVFDTLTKGETVGVFQLSTPLSTEMCKETKIDTFEDIASVLAIARPGSLHSGMTKNFIDRKHGKKWKAKNSIYEKITEKTYGVLIYQEQVMEVFHKVAGLPYSVADNIRKIIGKKRDVGEFEQYKEQFLKGCLSKNTFDEEEVEWFWEMLLECSDYLFNRCLSGREGIYGKKNNKTGKQLTIEQMFKIKNDKEYAKKTGHLALHKKYKRLGYGMGLSLCDGGRLRKNKIVDIYYSGELPVYQIVSECGRKLNCTLNHSIPTPNGIKKLSEMSIGDEIFVKGKYEVCRKKYNFYDKFKRKNFPNKGQMGFQKNPNGESVIYENAKENYHKKQKSCFLCKKKYFKNVRFELHHIDGNKSNNEKSNLQFLCVSCHKKEHYKLGRVKQYEKGIPVSKSKIISIKFLRNENCYDVEMSSPYHNFLTTNNIVVSNSHAIEYAILAYWTAWTKYFYPTEFICASLSCGEELKKEELIEEAYRIGLKIIPPKIEISNAVKWKAKDNSLYCPFIEIKGFGESTAQKCVSRTLPNNSGFFELSQQKEIVVKTKIDKILNEIKAFDKNIIPDNINQYFSFNLLDTKEQQIKILKRNFKGYENNNELKNCIKCELSRQCKQPIHSSKGIYNIMIVGEAPGYEDDQQGRNFIGTNGKMIWEELEKYKLEKKMFHITNICKCYPSKNKVPNDKQMKICFENWLLKEIKDLNCSLILAFGNTALKTLSHTSPKGITKMNGKIEWSHRTNCPVCYVISPSAVLRGSLERKIFNQGIKVFAKKVKEGLNY